MHGHGHTRLVGLGAYVYFCPISPMGLRLAFYVLVFLENTVKNVTTMHVIGFSMLSSISLCGGL